MRRLWSSRIELFERCLFAVFGLWFFVTPHEVLIIALQSRWNPTPEGDPHVVLVHCVWGRARFHG
jgi:hypothetical protein